MSSLNAHTAIQDVEVTWNLQGGALSLGGCVSDKSQCTVPPSSPDKLGCNRVKLDFKDYQIRSEGEQSHGAPLAEEMCAGYLSFIFPAPFSFLPCPVPWEVDPDRLLLWVPLSSGFQLGSVNGWHRQEIGWGGGGEDYSSVFFQPGNQGLAKFWAAQLLLTLGTALPLVGFLKLCSCL